MTDELALPALRAMVELQTSAMLTERPLGFTFPELTVRLRQNCAEPLDERRVRHQLKRLCDRGVLVSPDRGVFVAGDAAGEGLAIEVRKVFDSAGGFVSTDELLENLSQDLNHRGRVSRLLSSSPDYQLGLPIEGFRKVWRLRDDLRFRVPLPGRYQLLELILLKMACGGAPNGWGVEALKALRLRVGQGLRDARSLRELSIDLVLALPLIREALDHRLEELRYSDPAMIAGCEDWIDMARGEEVLFELWVRIEDGDAAQGILDAACWNAIGRGLGFDAALLSRGALGRT